MADPLTTQKEIARLLGVDERSIRNYHKADPPIPTHRKGKAVLYPDAPCIRWWVDYQVAQAATTKGPSELDLAKQRKETGLARKIELEVALLEASQMPVELHERRLCERLEECAARLKGLNRYATQLRSAASGTDQELDDALALIEDELLNALRGVADDVPDDETPSDPAGAVGAA